MNNYKYFVYTIQIMSEIITEKKNSKLIKHLSTNYKSKIYVQGLILKHSKYIKIYRPKNSNYNQIIRQIFVSIDISNSIMIDTIVRKQTM